MPRSEARVANREEERTHESHLRRLRRRWDDARPFLQSSRRRLVALAAVSVTSGFLEAGSLLLLVHLALAISSGASRVSLSTGPIGLQVHLSIAGLLLTSAGVALIRLALQVVSAYLPARMSSDAQAELRITLFDAFLQASWDVQSREQEGRFVEALLGQVNRSTTAILVLADSMASGFNFSALMLSAVILNPLAAITILVSVSALFFGLRPLSLAARRLGKERSRAYLRISEAITESVRMAEDVQVFDASRAQYEIVRQRSDAVRGPWFRAQLLSGIVSSVYATTVLLLLVGGLGVVHLFGSSNLASVGAIVLIMVRALSYSQSLQSTYHRLNDVAPDMTLVRANLERFRDNARTAGSRPLPPTPSLAFDNVSFEYRAGVPALRDVSFVLDPGDAVGVVGPSGAGKSTLVQLLLRLRVPTSGHVMVDGVEAEEFSLSGWRAAMSYVPQDGRLIQGTVAENIAFFRDFSTDAIETAARLAGIHNEIEAMPNGYDTVIGQRADAVSGGQRQRITIARALVGRPSILILDEPTSALDLQSESIIQETLERLKGEIIIVIIAHRLSTLNSCDRLLVFQDGLLTAAGPARELVESNEFYRRAVQLSEVR